MYQAGVSIKVVGDDENSVVSTEFLKMDAALGLYCLPVDPIMDFWVGALELFSCSVRIVDPKKSPIKKRLRVPARKLLGSLKQHSCQVSLLIKFNSSETQLEVLLLVPLQ